MICPTISPSTLNTLVQSEWKENESPPDPQEDETYGVNLNPPVLGELPPGETFFLIIETSFVRRGSDGEDSQLLGFDIRPEKYHKGRSHDHGHDDLRSQAGEGQPKAGDQQEILLTANMPYPHRQLSSPRPSTIYPLVSPLSYVLQGMGNDRAYAMNALTM